MDEQIKQQQELITIAGGVEMEVAYQNNGDKEKVKVRQIPISKIQNFIFAMGNESEAIELYCDKPKGWADTLSVESASAIADKGQELNLPFFKAWFRRQMKWRESQQPGTTTGTTEEKNELAASGSALASSPSVSPTSTT
jgi:hypothetical protein